MARYDCIRCGATYHIVKGVNEEEHICKDIKQRLAKRIKQVAVVESIITQGNVPEIDDMGDRFYPIHVDNLREVAESIVQALSNRGVDNE